MNTSLTAWQVASLPPTVAADLFSPHPKGGLCVAPGADQRHFRSISLAADGTVLAVEFHPRSAAMDYACTNMGDISLAA